MGTGLPDVPPPPDGGWAYVAYLIYLMFQHAAAWVAVLLVCLIAFVYLRLKQNQAHEAATIGALQEELRHRSSESRLWQRLYLLSQGHTAEDLERIWPVDESKQDLTERSTTTRG